MLNGSLRESIGTESFFNFSWSDGEARIIEPDLCMNRKSKMGFLVAALILLLGVFGMWRYFDAQGEEKEENYERYADEANEMVAEFLRTEGHTAYAHRGRFVRVAGSGYATPGPWNVHGGFYLSLDRSAYFTGGTEQLQIIVQKGDKKGVFQPRPEHRVIYVSNPDLRGG